jgi:hypothetical protein
MPLTAAAITGPDGSQRWLLDGELHREDGPAVISAAGSKSWYRYGKRHREDGPAIEMAGGTLAWFENGERHREGGPAIQLKDGRCRWWCRGQLHREDGPAIENNDGVDEGRWFIRGRPLSGDEIIARKEALVDRARQAESVAVAAAMREGLRQPLRCMKPPALK